MYNVCEFYVRTTKYENEKMKRNNIKKEDVFKYI